MTSSQGAKSFLNVASLVREVRYLNSLATGDFFVKRLGVAQEKSDVYKEQGMGELSDFKTLYRPLKVRSEMLSRFLEEGWLKQFNTEFFKDKDISDARFFKEIKGIIGFQHPKPTGKCYFAASAMPLEIWRLKAKGRFYIKNFILASMRKEMVSSTHQPQANVFFEIDFADFNSYATLLNADVCIVSPYNVYEWSSHSVLEDGSLLVKLRFDFLDFEI